MINKTLYMEVDEIITTDNNYGFLAIHNNVNQLEFVDIYPNRPSIKNKKDF